MTARTQSRATPPRRRVAPAGPALASREPARVVLWAVVALVNVAVLTNLFEPFQLPKAVALTVGGAVLLGLVAWELAATGSTRVPVGRVTVGVGAFVALLLLATVLNGHRLQSVYGDYGRSTGLLAYLAAAVVFLSVLRTHGRETMPRLALVVLASAVPVIGIALLQVLGHQPFGLTAETVDVVGTLGQANFVAGYAGVTLPFALWAAIQWRREPLALAAAGALAVAIVVVGLHTSSFQAIPAMAAGALVVVLVVVHERAGARTAGILVGGLAVAAVVLGLAGHAYLDRQVRSGLEERVQLWQAGRNMVLDRPVLGSGPAGYAAEFSAQRPRSHAVRFGYSAVADSPHDVPLWMFVTGGLPLGLLYLAMVGATGRQLVRGLRRERGDARLLLAAFGGAWVAYQVQSTVSIETPTLLVAQAVTAGAIWVLAGGAPLRTLTVGALAPVRSGTSGLVRRSTFVRGGVVLLAAGALWFASLPVRADVAFRHSLELAAGQSTDSAILAARSAVSLASWNGRYWANQAALEDQVGNQAGALHSGWQAALRTPSALTYSLSAGQVAHQLGRDEDADRYFAYARRNGPGVADVSVARAEFLLDVGRPKDARRELQTADELRPDDASILAELGTADARTGREAEARRTWERVLELQPANATALEGLGRPAP